MLEQMARDFFRVTFIIIVTIKAAIHPYKTFWVCVENSISQKKKRIIMSHKSWDVGYDFMVNVSMMSFDFKTQK